MPGHVEVHMRDSDAFSWYVEKDPLLRSTVVCVLLIDTFIFGDGMIRVQTVVYTVQPA